MSLGYLEVVSSESLVPLSHVGRLTLNNRKADYVEVRESLSLRGTTPQSLNVKGEATLKHSQVNGETVAYGDLIRSYLLAHSP